MNENFQATKLQPACETYQETLTQLKTFYIFGCGDSKASDVGEPFGEQFTYAKVASQLHDQSSGTHNGTFNSASQDWAKIPGSSCKKKSGNPSYCNNRGGYTGCFKKPNINHTDCPTSHETATPYRPFSKGLSSKQGSPVDGISHIELPSGYQDLLLGSEGCEDKQQPVDGIRNNSGSCTGDVKSRSSSSPPSNGWTFQCESDCDNPTESSSKSHETKGAASADSSSERYAKFFHDCFHNGDSDLTSEENFEEKFLAQLCEARESCDGWDKYFEMLSEICLEDSDCTVPETKTPTPSTCTDFSTLDGFDEIYADKSLASGSQAAKNVPSDTKTKSTNSTNSGKSKGNCQWCKNTQLPVRAEKESEMGSDKERVYFVNGSCYSSSRPPKEAHPRPRKDMAADVGKEKQETPKTEKLSGSEQDFYRNLGLYYFGSGKVKYKKKVPKEEEEEEEEARRLESEGTGRQSSSGSVMSPNNGKVFQNRVPASKAQSKEIPPPAVHSRPASKGNDQHYNGDGLKSDPNYSFGDAKNIGLGASVGPDVTKKQKMKAPPVDCRKEGPRQRTQEQRKPAVDADKVHMPKGRRPAFPEQTGRRHKSKASSRQRRMKAQDIPVNSRSNAREREDTIGQHSAANEITTQPGGQVDFRKLRLWLKDSGLFLSSHIVLVELVFL